MINDGLIWSETPLYMKGFINQESTCIGNPCLTLRRHPDQVAGLRIFGSDWCPWFGYAAPGDYWWGRPRNGPGPGPEGVRGGNATESGMEAWGIGEEHAGWVVVFATGGFVASGVAEVFFV